MDNVKQKEGNEENIAVSSQHSSSVENITDTSVTTDSNDRPKTVCQRCPPHNHVKRKVTLKQAMKEWELYLESKKRIHPTLESQFKAFSTMVDSRRDGRSINLLRSDYWFKQAKVLEDITVTMLDTGSSFEQFIDKTVPPPEKDDKKKKGKKKKDHHSKTDIKEEEPLPPDELTYKLWLKHVENLCKLKDLDVELIKEMLRTCGLPNKEPWVDTPKSISTVSTSVISLNDDKCRCICEGPLVEPDPYIHMPRPNIFIIEEDNKFVEQMVTLSCKQIAQ